jgi:hypothetical protein
MSARCEGVRLECGCHFGRTPTTQSLSAICFAGAFIEQGVTGLGALLPSFRPMSLSHFKSTQILDCLLRHLQSWCRSLCNCRPLRRGGLQYSGLCPWWPDFRWLLFSHRVQHQCCGCRLQIFRLGPKATAHPVEDCGLVLLDILRDVG